MLRGIKTLGVRMDRHETNGRALAELLARHPKVVKVLYPGLPDHPGHEVQKRQATGFGALLTFDHKTVLTVIAFIVIGALLAAHYRVGLRGRRAARLVLIGYLLVTLVNPLPLMVTGLGVFDLWADFRKPKEPES